MNNKAHLSRHSGCNPSDVLIFVELVNVIIFHIFVETILSITKGTRKSIYFYFYLFKTSGRAKIKINMLKGRHTFS